MVISVYHARKFSSGLRSLRRGGNTSGTIQNRGRPSTAKTHENVEKVVRIVRGDCRLNIRAISELTNINKESVRQILHDDLGMRKVCAKVVPKRCVPKWCQKDVC